MTKLRNVPWPRVFAESAIIVASILLALGVDTWWNNRQERLDEAVILNALRFEIVRFIQFREREQIKANAIKASAQKLLDFARNPTDDVSDQQIDAWLSDTTWYTVIEGSQQPVAEALISGGRLSLISNRELRGMILTWPFFGTSFVSIAETDRELLHQRYLPYLDANASIAQIYAADDGMPGHEEIQIPLTAEIVAFDRISHRELVQKRDFRNLLIQRQSTLTEFTRYAALPDGISSLEEGLALLRAEISRLGKWSPQ